MTSLTPLSGVRPHRPPEDLLSVIATQRRIIGALMMREIYTRFGRDNIGFLWVMVEPVLFCLGVIGMWSVVGHEAHVGAPIVPFLLTGYMPLLMYRHCVIRCMRCMQGNAALLYHRPLTIFSMYIARMLVEMLGAVAGFILCLFIFGVFGWAEMPKDIPLLVGGWFFYTWYSFAVALTIGAVSERSEVVDKLWNPISYIMIPASGTFYMLSWLPDALKNALSYFPQVNAVEMVRGGQFGPAITTYYDTTFLTWSCAILTLLGLFALKDIRRHVEVE